MSSRRFQPGEGPSRGLLRDCTTGCGTDGALHSTTHGSIILEAGVLPMGAGGGDYTGQPRPLRFG